MYMYSLSLFLFLSLPLPLSLSEVLSWVYVLCLIPVLGLVLLSFLYWSFVKRDSPSPTLPHPFLSTTRYTWDGSCSCWPLTHSCTCYCTGKGEGRREGGEGGRGREEGREGGRGRVMYVRKEEQREKGGSVGGGS